MPGVLEGLTYSGHSECGSVEPGEGKSECLCPGWGDRGHLYLTVTPFGNWCCVCVCVCVYTPVYGDRPIQHAIVPAGIAVAWMSGKFGWVVWPSP